MKGKKATKPCKRIFSFLLTLVLTALVFTAAGCRRSASDKDSVEKALQRISEGQGTEAAEPESLQKPDDPLSDDINRQISERSNIEVLESTEEKITVRIDAPDLSAVIEDLKKTDFSEMNYSEGVEYCKTVILNALNSGEYKTVSNTVDLNCSYEDGEMRVEYNDDYLNALYPGLYDYLNSDLQSDSYGSR